MTIKYVLLDGHEFKTACTLEEDENGQPIAIAEMFAQCTCGWKSQHGHYVPGGKDTSDADESAELDWSRSHYPAAARTAAPKELVDRMRSVEADVDRLTERHPLAALRLAVQSGGLLGTKAKAAALQASLDYSWAEIGQVIGISKQAAWERYGKHRAEATS